MGSVNVPEDVFECALENSFKNFHAKGFDYLCLRRTPEFTDKVYFFRGKSDELHDVVNPHNHRYDFRTICLAGMVSNVNWVRNVISPEAYRMDTFSVAEFNTPLNGGDGFSITGEAVELFHTGSPVYRPGQSYYMRADEIHTIQVERDTVIRLHQFEDVVPAGKPTETYSTDPDSLVLDSGLYERFTPDELRTRFKWLEEING